MNYHEKRSMCNDELFDKAWDFCQKEFGSMWTGIELNKKRDLLLEVIKNYAVLKNLKLTKVFHYGT